MPISYFQGHFSGSKISRICPFFSLKNIKLREQFLLMEFFEKNHLENTGLFSKAMPIFCQPISEFW
jgi:hypothetical protein